MRENEYMLDEDIETAGESADDIEFEYNEDGEAELDIPDDDDISEEREIQKTDIVDELSAKSDKQDKDFKEFERLTKEVLDIFGIEGDDVKASLERIVAEAHDQTPEEYRESLTKEEERRRADEFYRAELFRRKKEADLSELKSIFPETEALNDISEIENFEEFGKLRDAGYSVKQAYAATNVDGIIDGAVRSGRREVSDGSKSHMRSNVTRGVKDTSVTMTKEEYEQFKELFPKKTKAEILELYQKTK